LVALGVVAVVTASPGQGLIQHHVPTDVAAYQQPLGVRPTRSLVVPSSIPGQRSLPLGSTQVLTGSNYLYGSDRSGWGYTSLGQAFYQRALCPQLVYIVCPEGVDFLLSREPETGQQWVEVLGLRTLVLSDELVGRFRRDLVGRWRPTTGGAGFQTLVRVDGTPLPGRLSTVPFDATVIASADTSAQRQSYQLADQPGGLVTFGDIYWPGYTATFNGQPVDTFALAGKIVAVRLPPGPGDLTVRYVPAGATFALGSTASGLALLSILLLWRPLRRRRRALSGEEDAQGAAR
jgi:hypothetical protein